MSENLFAYTISDYSKSEAGAITGTRNATTVDAAAAKAKISDLNGDAACFNFMDNNNASKLVFRQYTYSTTDLLPNRIISAQGNWATPVASPTWNGVANMHAVASKNNYLFATGYDLAKVVVADMTDATAPYGQKFVYDFPTTLKQPGHVYHGEGLAVRGNFLYALFSDNIGSGYDADYDKGYVVQYQIAADGSLTYTNKHVRVGKNGFTLELHGNKMYVCALGGMQKEDEPNADTCISIVTIANLTNNMSVTNALLPSGVTGDFRDISITAEGDAYIFSGYYSLGYTTFKGYIYKTTVTNLSAAAPAAWTNLKPISAPGYFWAIHCEGADQRFWFVKGNVIEVYPSDVLSATPTSFDAAALAAQNGYTNINAACFIAEDASVAATGTTGSKAFVGHARLARQAYELAKEAKK